jgi:hypothetical protein
MSASARDVSQKSGRTSEDVFDQFDQVDVPATVVCAICGDAECPGCKPSELSSSGIVTLIAWERQGARVMPALWETARAATRDATAFFELLPDGPIAPALRFAITCEMLAATGAVFATIPFAAVLAPGWLKHVVLDTAARELALRFVAAGIPTLALLLVLAHAAHGLSLDRGARKSGARAARSRALRFGLYSTGWDLVIGPIGALIVAVKEGLRASVGLLAMMNGLPTRASRAFLRGCYRLDGRRADTALTTSYVTAIVATIIAAIFCLGGIVAVMLATA